jgi:hypothetical protein
MLVNTASTGGVVHAGQQYLNSTDLHKT